MNAAGATTVDSYFLNRDGVAKLQAKSYFPAYQDFTKALEDDPLNPELHLNLALSFELHEEYDKAEQGYKGALKLLPEKNSRRFEALFNLAGVQAKNKKIDEALQTYQAALEIDPDSKEVKTMIELLWQGGGGGGGDGENKDQKQDGEGKGRPKDPGQQPDQPQQKQKQQPKPFNSQNLTPQDVKKILDEIKNQEQGIRAQENDKSVKDAPHGKDW
jgi:tetratricopeptide (TPR) repeat protein